MIEEIAELNRIRLDDGLTYEELTQEIARACERAGIAADDLDASSIYRLINEPHRKPFDRTLHRVRAFLEHRKAATSKRRARA